MRSADTTDGRNSVALFDDTSDARRPLAETGRRCCEQGAPEKHAVTLRGIRMGALEYRASHNVYRERKEDTRKHVQSETRSRIIYLGR